jgi:alkane 1-monooxygenase
MAMQGVLLAGVHVGFGSIGTLVFIASALIGALLLQSVNYIEHYGLSRVRLISGGYEKVQPWHSWNSSHPLSRSVLFELSRHSDHHANATRKYPLLRHFDEAPQMPTGYPGMILLALVPPLWFKVMNPRIQNPKIST